MSTLKGEKKAIRSNFSVGYRSVCSASNSHPFGGLTFSQTLASENVLHGIFIVLF